MKTLHVIGDSHCEALRSMEFTQYFKSTRFEYCIVPGASNMGLANPRSKTNAGEVFNAYLTDDVAPEESVVVWLGEVDCGFVIWYRAQKYSMDVASQFQESLNNYMKLIKLAAKTCKNVIVISVPLPTITDGQDWGDVANARREVSVNQFERTQLTLEYSKRLHAFCKDEGLKFIDLIPVTYNPDSGVIYNNFLNSDPLDHHHDIKAISPLIARELNGFGFQ